ncbi:unnamed protein product [Penicillium salamii]|nr:unnamed protein product [Penicillium salamii]CAG8102466.1 unnamed protein product [Penicillium salamii]CAG8393360.1 unnamed protein product [Penicillium salamii]
MSATHTDHALAHEHFGSEHKPSNVESAQGLSDYQAAEDPSGNRQIRGFKYLSILSSIFLYALDNTIVADIIPVRAHVHPGLRVRLYTHIIPQAIVDDFSSVDNLGWLTVGFNIGGVAVIMPLGKLYGLFDAKWLYIGSVTIFLAASALCGAAPNVDGEIVGRVFAGAGGIGIYIGVMILLSVNTGDQERPMYLSLVGLIWGIGTFLGPVVGGAFEKVTWRWAFYINLVIGGALCPIWFFLLPSFHPAKHLSLGQRFRKFDSVGTILSIGAVVATMMPINFGGVLYAWNSGQIIALFVVASVLWILFAAQQTWTFLTGPLDRMFPVQFLRNKEALLLFILAAACNASDFIPIYYIPIYFQFTRGDSAHDSAVRLLPLIFLLCGMVLASGYLMSRFGYYMPWYTIGAAVALIGNVLLSQINAGTSPSYVYGSEAMLGLGGGAFVQAGYAVIQTVVPPEDLGYAVSFMMIAQIGGIALGLSCASAVFVNGATLDLQQLLPNTPTDALQSSITGTGSAVLEKLSPEMRETALNLIISNMSKTKRVFVPTGAGA